ncbi:DUF6318 family protein [Dermabacter jinjuensis]|uniref:DUF6318 family protein n=1 Tax=Dermabacter jinjuensis TaxID=1667168 RepID=UPI0012378C84|nr:DUF6318 family protein [Dermabacter jinjuensis]UEB90611.1 DUF6318 family protein [Dermabacter jinjuensis]
MLSGRARACGVFGVVALVAAGLVGCGGGEPAGGPTPAAQPSASSSSSDAGGSDSGGGSDGGGEASGRTPNLPPENAALEAPDFKDYTGIKYETDQGAQETAKYFFDAMYYGYATGDTSPFKRVANASECPACAKKSEQIVEWSTKGKFLTPSEVTEVSLETVERTKGWANVQYEFDVSALDVVSGEVVERSYPETRYRAIFRLKFAKGQWSVVDCAWEKVDEDSKG